MINVDHFLKIGNSHRICEDYIISGTDPIPYVILSDGCSSSQHTDIGARILCHKAFNYLYSFLDFLDNINFDRAGVRIIDQAKSVASLIPLPENCLDATLIMAYCLDDKVYISVYGDGHILLRDKNTLKHYSITFSDNAPFYLNYYTNPKREMAFGQRGNSKIFSESLFVDKEKKIYGDQVISKREPFTLTLSFKFYDSILIASDGLESFNFENCPDAHMWKSLTDFKSLNGKFLLRRARKVINEYEKKGFVHHDDISLGGFVKTNQEG